METRPQRYGDLVVLYGRYVAVMESGGVEQTVMIRGDQIARAP